MDLTIPLEKMTLNIRVAVLIKKDGGMILEKSKGGYYFPIGGRMKVGETSEEVVRREVQEEIGASITEIKLRAIVELFFGEDDNRVQEICFVYAASIEGEVSLAKGFGTYTLEQIEAIDFRPQIIKEVIKAKNDDILHFMVRE